MIERINNFIIAASIFLFVCQFPLLAVNEKSLKTYKILFWAFPIAVMLIGLLLRIFVKKKPDIVPETAGEVRIGEMYCKTRQVKFKGILIPPYDGKLILTKFRLMYCNFYEKQVAFSIRPKELLKIETQANTLFSSAVSFQPDFIQLSLSPFSSFSAKIPSVIYWTVPDAAPSKFVDDNFPKDKISNPHTAESFAILLRKWKDRKL